ncbi:DUF4129 domain-containing protein [Streptomyces sp. B6B3]|uniref:DUF4129 domain-containing protein n=1 Tax=Streptomyces sp. B6B3 TaxID=3153570 RepID=UPI00325E4DD2
MPPLAEGAALVGARVVDPVSSLVAAVPAARGSDEPGPPVEVGRDAAREAAERELNKPMYAEHEPGPVRRVWNWVWEHVFGALESAAFNTPGGWLGLLLILVLAVGLIVALRMRLGALRTAAGPPRAPLFTDRPRSAAEHRAAAAEHARGARWDQAVQERLRAVVRALEERVLLEPRPGRTADEAAAEAGRALPGLAAELRAAAHTFDEVTYGGRPAGQADYDRLRELDERQQHSKPDLTTTRPAAS